MNQYPSHSQTPEFGIKKSATSARLYQEPTVENTVVYKGFSNFFSNLCATLLLFILLAGTSYVLLITADREAQLREEAQNKQYAEEQHNHGEKYRMKYTATHQ
ncbi:hypothetical protein G9F32_02950 [Acinetobacter sp. 194]|uniref:hypothetical protein n=1 Tax=Acinetobacter shaoyimingii TaxID=2715164 RepID=UPI00140E0889|nr:hypothetical protein [Acinetobacter shaoyimingii]NHB56993.1 hypothetical protein [Acinetobacter shaoyimingii]